jgi:hypothetical protein
MKFWWSQIKKVLLTVTAGSILFMLVAISCNFFEYYSIMENNYSTPWYNNSWFLEPYTHLMMIGKPTHVYWSMNAECSEVWKIKEVTIKNKTFWTILERLEVSDKTNDI